ncbi:MAG TPA: Npt1/Npt2 family nucleotide transporter [Steroidobacteraceae bacterium]|nr:Npt1/Npt2 family nucleotide transporter [Steroidobacteraceae bacterium]
MNPSQPREPSAASPLARLCKSVATVEPSETRAVILSMLFGLLLFGSYSVVKPVRDTMGTVWGVRHLQDLFTGTLIGCLLVAPLYSALAARVKLSTFLPWVYVAIGASILAFYAVFESGRVSDRWIAAVFYVWVSVFNMLIISVFWTFMADTFSRAQAKRLFGFVAAGITIGGIIGPAIATLLAKALGNYNLMLISAVGFVLTAGVVRLLVREKERMLAAGVEAQHTSLAHRLGSANPFAGFSLLLRSRYLLLLALFLLLMSWISTVVYVQLSDLIQHSFRNPAARTQAYALIDLTVNSIVVFVQLFGTGRLINRFGVTTGLMLNPVIMVIAFLAVAFSPVLLVLGGIQIVRRAAEYAVAKPSREMLFTVVDQESRYKAKNVIDTVVYRFGDVSAVWISSAILPHGVGALAVFGALISAVWFPIAWLLGKRYESARGGELGSGPSSRPTEAVRAVN